MKGMINMANIRYGKPNLLALKGEMAKKAWDAIISTPPVDFTKLRLMAEEGKRQMLAERYDESK